MNPKRKALLYSRVSTDEQAEKGNSLKHQKFRLEKHCLTENIEVEKLFVEDFSAKTFNRPAFNKLLAYAKKHYREIDYLLILKWDRFSRNAGEAYQMLNTFDKLGIKVQAIEQPLDLSIPENKLMLAIYLASPQVENERRGLNTKAGMRRAMKDGRHMGMAPIGYKNARDQNNKPIIIKSKLAPLVRLAFEKYATGLYKKEELSKIMNRKGLKVSKTRFPVMLSSLIYAGKIYIPPFQDESEEIVEAIHEPIVSEEMFDKVQEVLKNNKRLKTRQRYSRYNDEIPFRGLLICRRCNRPLTGSKSKGRKGVYYPYYHCRSKCGERIPAKKAHTAIEKLLQEVKISPEIAELYLLIMEDIFKTDSSKEQNHLVQLKNQFKTAAHKLEKLEEKFILDAIELDSYQRMKPKYKNELLKLQQEIEHMQAVESSFQEYLNFGVNLLENLDTYFEKSPTNIKRKLLSSIFPKNIIYENEKCRTAQVNEVVWALQGFKQNFLTKKMGKSEDYSAFSLVVAEAVTEHNLSI